MTLRKRIFLKNLVLIATLLLLASVSMIGLASLRRVAQVALDEYRELRTSEGLKARLTLALSELQSASVAPSAEELRSCIAALENFVTMQAMDDDEPVEHNVLEKQAANQALAHLSRLSQMVSDQAGKAIGAEQSKQLSAELTAGIAQLNLISNMCDQQIQLTQSSANSGLRTTMIVLACLSIFSLIAAALVTASLSRSILGPLRKLQGGVRRVAQARFSDRLQMDGDREFVELATDFNQMAGELDGFYKRLEDMVATKSRELVRSERLASVGYLAAGVAHEINNPLGIISGHAELLERRLKNAAEPNVIERTQHTLNVIRTEAFRCKEITARLLSLARNESSARTTVSLAEAAADITVLVHGLKPLRQRTLISRLDPSIEPLNVIANATEMKQVLLNLVVNAMEAVEDGSGRVVMDGARDNNSIVLTITDNGKGIAAGTIEHVFEPFFTDKRGAGTPGTGLGLSITHAIVSDHGGSISASSDGPGKGSCFTIRLPAASQQQPRTAAALQESAK